MCGRGGGFRARGDAGYVAGEAAEFNELIPTVCDVGADEDQLRAK